MSSKSHTAEDLIHKDETLLLEDLASWQREGVSLAVLGFPIRHSLSPVMHNAALREMAKRWPEFSDWHYYRLEVEPERLPEALRRLYELRFRGVNLTVPHKVLALKEVSGATEEALAAQAVNTLHWSEDGYYGYNTDGYGLREALKQDLQLTLSGKSVVLLGAGGAARGAAQMILQENCANLWIGNRNTDRLQELLSSLSAPQGTTVRGFSLQESRPKDFPSQGVLINATSCGLSAEDPLPLDLAWLQGREWSIYDMVYKVGDTPFVRTARESGFSASGGLSMLVHQGARALEVWTGKSVPVSVMYEAAHRQLYNGIS
jgi:shikimate dehydrogenase